MRQNSLERNKTHLEGIDTQNKKCKQTKKQTKTENNNKREPNNKTQNTNS